MKQQARLIELSEDNDLAPWLTAPKSYRNLRVAIRKALGFPNERRPLLIGVDGLDGAGKTSLAAWLSWQLEIPAVHLDLYMVRGSTPLEFRAEDLAQTLDARAKLKRPVILEGILLLQALSEIDRTSDFLIYVHRTSHRSSLPYLVQPYLHEFTPRQKANAVVKWSSLRRDRQIVRAHQERR
jgi:uridine kinase